MATLDITHSGEFGLAYDDWPFWYEPWPEKNRDESAAPSHGTLQIPVHPICLGLFDDARTWLDYFLREADARYRTGEPLFFYGHPTGRLGRYPELLSQFLAEIDRKEALWKVSARRLAEWWRVRARIFLTVHREGEMIVVRHDGPRSAFQPAVEIFHQGQSARVAMDRPELRFSSGSIAWQRSVAFDESDRPTPRPSRLGLRDRFKRAIDWEKETPIDEIALGGWRGGCKMMLRKIFRDQTSRQHKELL